MRDFIHWLRSVRVHRVQYDDVDCYVVAHYGFWVPGDARTRIGAFLLAWRAHRSYGKD